MTIESIHDSVAPTLTVVRAGMANYLFFMLKQDPSWTLVDHEWEPQRPCPDPDVPTCPNVVRGGGICGEHIADENCYFEHWRSGATDAFLTRYMCHAGHVWAALWMGDSQ